MNEIESLWDRLLSRKPEEILPAFQSLHADEQGFILKHLVRMITEEGWQPSQRESARIAMEALGHKPADGITK